MKFRPILQTGALLSTFGLLSAQDAPPGAPGAPQSHGDPFTPIGNLKVTPTVVQPGVHPEMFWNIDYPQSIPDLVVIDAAGGMTTINDKSDKLTIRVAGVAEGSDRVALWVRIDNGGWNLAFYGTDHDVNAGAPVFTTTVHSGTRIDFAARGTNPGGGWSNVQWTLNSNSTLDALLDGSPLPSAISTAGPESFMTQNIGNNNDVEAGPRDVIHVFEVETDDPTSPEYDMQDIVVVSTFGRSNNGHGNNLDGVDVSNPGQGHGGPNGEEDASLNSDYIDDERKVIKKKK